MVETAKASSQGLEKVKQAALKKGWRKTSAAFLDTACVSAATLKRFWRGVPISTESFRSICEAVNIDAEQVAEHDNIVASTTADLAPEITAPDAPPLLFEDRPSRQSLRQSLRTQLLNSTRILAITGLTGIGKTTLARNVASDLEADGYTCIHLSCDSNAPLTLAAIAHTISTSNLFNFSELQNRLDSQRYLLVIDQFEHLLSNDPDTGWGSLQNSIWRNFFQSVLEKSDYASRFLLISQDVPNEIGLLSKRYLERWHLCTLAGLTHLEQIGLFQASGIIAAAHSDYRETRELDYLIEIGLTYAGHPLALQTIANDITHSFQSNIAAYYKKYAAYLRINLDTKSDNEMSATNLHSHSLLLQQQVQPRLVQSIARLKQQIPDAFKLLRVGGYAGKPISTLAWMQRGQGIELSPTRCRTLLGVLCDRSLLIPSVQNNQLYYQLHPLVRSLVLTQIP